MKLLVLALMLGQTAEDAAHRYDGGDYSGAGAIWDELLARSGPGDPAALQYNLGNARFREGRLGLAMLHWERSLLERPGDSDALANLALARGLVADRLGNADSFARDLHAAMDGPGARLARTPRSRLRIALLAAVFLAGALLTARILGSRRRLLTVGLVLGVLASGVLVALLALRSARPDRALVIAPAAVIRSGPADSFPQLARLPEGLEVEVRGAPANGWIPVRAAGIVGFAEDREVAPIAAYTGDP